MNETPTEVGVPNYTDVQRSYYERAYADGYGVAYPEGHVIRTFVKVLKNQLGITGSQGEKLLDVGCGTGTHAAYFESLGFEVYGFDTSPRAIAACHSRMPDSADRFQVSQPSPSAYPDLDDDFDVVLANQVLYFLSAQDLRDAVHYLYNRLRPGGVLIASMMGTQNYYFDRSAPAPGGMRRVELGKDKVLYIHFTASSEELVEQFEPFAPLHTGYYDSAISSDEGSGFHYLYIGRKAG